MDYSVYGNGQTREYAFDNQYRVKEVTIDGTKKFLYTYDSQGNLHQVKDLVQGITYKYIYDMLGRPVQVRTSDGFRIKLSYDQYNRASDVKFEFGSSNLTTTWRYGKSSIVYGVKYNGVEKITYNYDSLMRRTKTTINTTNPFITSYSYKDHASEYNRTSTQLQAISYSNNKGFKYTYDANGNITSIKDINNNAVANYYYDALNQLTREDNKQLNKTITYTYDNGGNILAVKEYAYTTGTLGSVVNQKTYTYGDSEWKDLLTNYNGTNLTYDAIGNPLNWINGETFTWSAGRQLTDITKGNNTISYAYNDSGIRTSKTVNNVRTDYYLNGTAIIMQKTGDNCIWYTYDENGLVTGFRYNGAEYYYFRNAQSDIIGIVNSAGAVVANYTYDSWGNHIAITDGNGNNVANNPNHIANINPFRYRGYYFDTETGLYYLQSRYYDANVGRFLNADGYVSTGQGVTGNNMFAYCGNNPVNFYDSSGYCRVRFDGVIIEDCYSPLCNTHISNTDEADVYSVLRTKSKQNKKIYQKDKRHGSERRQPSGQRQRNIGHRNGEEHSRVPKGNGSYHFGLNELPSNNTTESEAIITGVYAALLIIAVVLAPYTGGASLVLAG